MENLIKAASMFKAGLIENKAQLIVPLEDYIICLVENMPHSHRSIWVEDNLLLFHYNSEEYNDYLTVSNDELNGRRGIYIINRNKQSLQDQINDIAMGNLQYQPSITLNQNFS